MTAVGYEKQYLGYVLIDSGRKCQEFADRLSAVQRGASRPPPEQLQVR
jgi:hypothetical protein